MKSTFIFDIDGTLANNDHRHKLIGDKEDPNRWDKFSAAAGDDSQHTHVFDILMALVAAKHGILFMTGRAESIREVTVNWFCGQMLCRIEGPEFVAKHFGSPSGMAYWFDSNLFMRMDNDHCDDTELKKRMFGNLTAEIQQSVAGVFEDRARVVAMWRSIGVPCFQVAEANF